MRKIIIDTDPGVDDAIALAMLCASNRENIAGIVSTYGNCRVKAATRNLCGLCELFHIEAPIIQGSALPLHKSSFSPTDFHGEFGLMGIKLTPKSLPQRSDYRYELLRLIEANAPVTYLALGPLTNLAGLLNYNGGAADMIERIVIMGGGLDIFNSPHNSEYNFHCDGGAVRQILKSGLDITLSTLDTTAPLVFSHDELMEIAGDDFSEPEINGTNLTGRLLRAFVNTREPDSDGFLIHDGAAVFYLISPGSCRTHEERVLADRFGALTRDGGGECVKILSADKTGFKQCLTDTVRFFKNLR